MVQWGGRLHQYVQGVVGEPTFARRGQRDFCACVWSTPTLIPALLPGGQASPHRQLSGLEWGLGPLARFIFFPLSVWLQSQEWARLVMGPSNPLPCLCPELTSMHKTNWRTLAGDGCLSPEECAPTHRQVSLAKTRQPAKCKEAGWLLAPVPTAGGRQQSAGLVPGRLTRGTMGFIISFIWKSAEKGGQE